MNGYIAWKILQTCELHLHVAFVGYVLLNMWIFLSGEHRCGRGGRWRWQGEDEDDDWVKAEMLVSAVVLSGVIFLIAFTI